MKGVAGLAPKLGALSSLSFGELYQHARSRGISGSLGELGPPALTTSWEQFGLARES